jgi:putative transposase
MREAGLQGARRGRTKFTTRHDAKAARPPDLVDRDFRAEAPDRLWIADLTYVRTWAGFCYVAFVEDVFSRMIVGWSIATHLRASLATEALEMVWRRGASVEGLIHLHLGRLLRAPRRTRDRSVGQQHRRFVRQRHGGVGDRALQDRADPPAGPWRNPDQVEFATLEYIDWFNNQRLHGEIGHVPPAEFEEVFYASRVEEQIKA